MDKGGSIKIDIDKGRAKSKLFHILKFYLTDKIYLNLH